jgi:hypothetical protein
MSHQTTDGTSRTPPGANGPDVPARLANLIAAGEAVFPRDLDGPGAAELANEVRRLRAERLVQFLARAIAHAIRRADQEN